LGLSVVAVSVDATKELLLHRAGHFGECFNDNGS
jgi:hypothetical protein